MVRDTELRRDILMGRWITQKDDELLPVWLTENLISICSCGGYMENFYNDDQKITFRRCSNPECPFRLAQKIVSMCDLLGIKGVGPKSALNIVKSKSITNQYQAIPYIVSTKPTVSLYTFLRMSFTRGVDTGWGDVANKYSTLDECLAGYNGMLRTTLDKIKPILLDGQKYVNFVQVEKDEFKTLVTGTVMLSGTIKGFQERNDFIAGINKVSKGLVKLSISEHKRKTGIMALIQESDSPNRGKAECALENNIPIMTPEQFQSYIIELIQERKGRL